MPYFFCFFKQESNLAGQFPLPADHASFVGRVAGSLLWFPELQVVANGIGTGLYTNSRS
jgi:hypothetical protein